MLKINFSRSGTIYELKNEGEKGKVFTPHAQKNIVMDAFEQLAKIEAHGSLKKKNSSFYQAIANATGKTKLEVRKKISDYIKNHPEKVLSISHEMSKKIGISLPNQKQLAYIVLTQIATEIFKINITMRNFLVIYDDLFGGRASELIKIETMASETAPHVELAQGVAIVNAGLFLDKKNHFFHIDPKEII